MFLQFVSFFAFVLNLFEYFFVLFGGPVVGLQGVV